jgi:2,4-dienoyl-CoA reductase-like NADH-dependent reductase (Old Yellow Enzyme family)
MITTVEEAEAIITTGSADAVMLGRELLRNPNWALNALSQLQARSPEVEPEIATRWPNQYLNGRPQLKLGW